VATKKSLSLFCGIDPGLTGAVALINSRGDLLSLYDTPTLLVKGAKNRHIYVESAMVAILEVCKNTGTVLMTAIENVHAMPGQGVTSMFSMGTGFGLWLGMLSALRMPYTRIEPIAWKKKMGIVAKSDKNASIIRALQLYPEADLARKKDHGRADAILIANYARLHLAYNTLLYEPKAR
jgi:crossover junction endodeoxyribonuclease RuvC